jgi:hypothetical protein
VKKRDETKLYVMLALVGVAAALWFSRPGKQLAQSAGGAIATMTEKIVSTVRGIRNNNPGNIRISSNAWQGKISPNTDGAFEQFDTMESGIRALGKTLLNYSRLYGLNTVAGIIARWAPGHENPTDAYVSAVAQRLGVAPSQTIMVSDRATLEKLARAIINFENGAAGALVSDATISAGINRALS